MSKKKKQAMWKMRNGNLIATNAMTNTHLVNSLRMLARSWLGNGDELKELLRHDNYKDLAAEAARRKFSIVYLTTPTTLNGKTEYIEVILPSPRSRISAKFFPIELDQPRQV